MSGFAMMYFQDPSLLQFQRRMEEANQQNNLRNMFDVDVIPGDTQLREQLDNAPSDKLEEVFTDYFRQLQRAKQLENYQFLLGKYLMPLDGSGYFSSHKISCPSCLVTTPKKGSPRYHHQILQAALIHPDLKQVIPLAPEPIKNTDGKDKQDCEINAGKRILKKIRQTHPKLDIIIVGDGLYSKQPFIKCLKEDGFSFILVAKPDDHKIMMEWVCEQEQLAEVSHWEYRDQKERVHQYRWINKVPLNGHEKTCWVNYFEYSLIVKGEITYHNSWVTGLEVDRGNVKQLVKRGTCPLEDRE